MNPESIRGLRSQEHETKLRAAPACREDWHILQWCPFKKRSTFLTHYFPPTSSSHSSPNLRRCGLHLFGIHASTCRCGRMRISKRDFISAKSFGEVDGFIRSLSVLPLLPKNAPH